MRHTVTGLAEKPIDAQRIIEDLTGRCLCDRSDISLVARDQPQNAASAAARGAGQLADIAGTAAVTTLEGFLGFASAATKGDSPTGVLRAAGNLGSLLAKTALGGAKDVARAFTEYGMESALAADYAEAVQRGSILIVVDAKTEGIARCAQQVLANHGAVTRQAA
jgi:hypothetical protein